MKSNNSPLIGLLIIGTSLGLVGCGGGDSPPAEAQPALLQLASTITPLTGATQSGVDFWPKGSTATGGRGATIDNVTCLANEDYHIHTQLTIIRDGQPLAVPADVGLQGCAYELHTHDKSGILHVETAVAKRFTLGQFFSVWGQALDAKNVAGISGSNISVLIRDGDTLAPYSGDPRLIELLNHRVIYVVIGKPPTTLPNYRWEGNL